MKITLLCVASRSEKKLFWNNLYKPLKIKRYREIMYLFSSWEMTTAWLPQIIILKEFRVAVYTDVSQVKWEALFKWLPFNNWNCIWLLCLFFPRIAMYLLSAAQALCQTIWFCTHNWLLATSSSKPSGYQAHRLNLLSSPLTLSK